MPYTLLRMTDAGMVLWDYHARRLEVDQQSAAHEPWLVFSRETAPGVWAVWTDRRRGMQAQLRPGSRLYDGMPARTLPSPVVDRVGQFPKPSSPGPYDQVRLAGTAT